MKKRYQVFVSSTYSDLMEERAVVTRTLLSMDCIPIGMEEFPAADEEQMELIKTVIDESDFYVLIIGGRYGSTDSAGVSFTEREYDYAISKGKPIIPFVRANRDSLPVNKTDGEKKKQVALEKFIEKATGKRLRKEWSSTEELAAFVMQGVMHAIKTKPAVGYVRADEGDTSELLRQINQLRIENAELKEKLEEGGNAAVNIPDIAELDETYIFKGVKDSVLPIDFGIKQNIVDESQILEIADTWINVFSVIAPSCSMGASDDEVLDILNLHFADKLRIEKFRITTDSFNIIKIQLMAQGLFGDDGDWLLTAKGKKALLLNNAVRTKRGCAARNTDKEAL